MISKFPDGDELLSFFGDVPVITDKDTPWIYNHLKFTYKDRDDLVVFETSPSYGDFEIRYFIENALIFDFKLHWVDRCTITEIGNLSTMVFRFKKSAEIQDCFFRLKPRPYIQFENVLYE
jgi:hypothetical protein